MANLGCNCRSTCTGLAVVASVIIGIITAILNATAIIAVTPAFLWVLFGIAALYLAVTLVTSVFIRSMSIRNCVCSALPALLAGALGTILLSIILLGIEFAATSVLGVIFTGALLFFFALLITSTACLVKCISGCLID